MNLGFAEMLFLVILALLLFGPRKLPEIARTMGKFMAEFKKASNEFQGQIHEEIRKLELEEADPRKHIEPEIAKISSCLLYTSPSPRDTERSRMPSSA